MSFGDFFGGIFGEDADNWATYEGALREWVLEASGLAAGSIIFAEQDGPRPTAPFAVIRVGDIHALGAVDTNDSTYDPYAPEGEEMVETTRGQREVTVTVQAFTASAIGGGSARALLSKVQTALNSRAIRDVLHEAGLTCFDRGSISVIPAILDTRWEGRAVLTARFYLEETVTYATGYITQTELTDQSVTPEETVLVP